MKSPFVTAVLAFAALHPADAQNLFVGFSQSAYTVQVDTPTAFDVVITHDPGDGLADDLFSFGTILVPELGAPVILHGIQAVADLDFFGFGPPAQQDLGAFGIKGTIDAANPMAGPYAGSLLATYTLSFDLPGDYDIGLDFFNTLGPTEQIFIAGDGTVLDPFLQFTSATFTVIPEPAEIAKIAGVMLVMLGGWRMVSRTRWLRR